jgi:hypothetical protein
VRLFKQRSSCWALLKLVDLLVKIDHQQAGLMLSTSHCTALAQSHREFVVIMAKKYTKMICALHMVTMCSSGYA